MSYDPLYRTATATAQSSSTAVDAGLQAFMRSVYNVMAAGLVVTGVTAWAVANVPALFNLVFGTPLVWVAAFAPLAFLWLGFTPARISRWPASKTRAMFIAFSALMGLSMAALFKVFAGADIARAFFVTAATFAAVSLYGYTTKRDLAGMGSFMFMGLIGIFFAALVNLFVQSAMMDFVVSVIGVVVFTGLTAWETQRLKETYSYNRGADEANARLAVTGALSLYLNFINLFQFILRFMGNRE